MREKNQFLRAAHLAFRRRRTLASGCAVLVGLAFGYHAVFGHNGITAYAQKRAEGRQLEQQVQQLEEENARLQEHVEHLQTDPGAIEHEARERLHYARPGAVIYTMNAAPKATAH